MTKEEKILEMLTGLTEKVEGLTGTIAKQGEVLAEHGAMLAKQDGVLVKQGKMLERMEKRMDELDARSLKSAVLLETEVARDIHLVYEGQELLRQKMEELAPKSRVDALEDDVFMLKDVVKLMRQEINELKKAQ